MQSTGHSSIHVLSLMSTQGSVIVYVTKASSISGRCGCCLGGGEATRWCRLTDACRGVSHPNLSRLAIRAYRLILPVHTAGGFLHRLDPATKRSYSSEVSDSRSSSTAPERPLVLLLRASRGPALLLQIRQLGLFLVLGMSLRAFLAFASDRRCCCSTSTTVRGCVHQPVSRSLLATPETPFACSRRRWRGPAAHCDRRSRRSRTFRCSSPRRERGSSR